MPPDSASDPSGPTGSSALHDVAPLPAPAEREPEPAARRHQRIHDLPQDERPREKMLTNGPGALTDAELLALFFRTGTKGLSAIDIGRLLLKKYGSLAALSRQHPTEIQKQKGLGPAKAMDLAAAFELGKRLARHEAAVRPLDCPESICELIGPEMRAEPLEVLKVILLTTRNTLLAIEEISRGALTETPAHPREIFRPALIHAAASIVLVHNHPSGDPSPSAADLSITRHLRDAASLLQIHFLDHLIIGHRTPVYPQGYYSFREAGVI
ncbi:MAG: repair protein RadC [Verrucomicrobiales bacterium]|nr:repair protein RadC [Verrucomicrobiales bacterium]